MRVFIATLTCLGLTAGIASAAQFETPPSEKVSRSIIKMGSQAEFDALERTRAEQKLKVAPKKKPEAAKQVSTSAEATQATQRPTTPIAASMSPAPSENGTDPLLRQALEAPSSGPVNTASPAVAPVAVAEPGPSLETTTAIPRTPPVADGQQVAPMVNQDTAAPSPVSAPAPAQNPFPSAGANAPSPAPLQGLQSMPSPVTGAPAL